MLKKIKLNCYLNVAVYLNIAAYLKSIILKKRNKDKKK